MMYCRLPRIVYDPYKVLPSYGESDVEVNFKSNTLLLKLYYEDEDTEEEKILSIRFDKLVFSKIESFPGVKGMNIEYESGDSISSLVEYADSEYKKEWESHFNGLRDLKHYKIYFLNVNKSIEVIGEGFEVID